MNSFFLRIYRGFRSTLHPLNQLLLDYKQNKKSIVETENLKCFLQSSNGMQRIFYLGRTENRNFGDNAQYLCITKWIKDNYPNNPLYITPSSHVTAKNRIWLNCFASNFQKEKDIIIFQSGYCVQDLGGDHPLMHELICSTLKEARILMMPQTIYFKHEKNRSRTAENHNQAVNMLFLARDKVSYEQALQMFPNIRVRLFPDIVTTLIGKYQFNNPRNKIYLCCRNDGEKYYSDKELGRLRIRLSSLAPVDTGDTQSHLTGDELRKVLADSLNNEFNRMSTYKVVITDRYHGTIFSLIANTPVIIIKTKDHKVTTGADWFTGIYDNHVYVADDLDDAYQRAESICKHFDYVQLSPYFDIQYYNKLKSIFDAQTDD